MSKLQLCLTLKPKVFLEPKSHRSPDAIPLFLEIPVLSSRKDNLKKNHLKLEKTDLKLEKKELKKKGPKPKRNKKDVKEKPRCIARIANGNQCRRFKNPKTDSGFCSCHETHCPHGRIDGPLGGKFINIPKKRGPKSKNIKDYTVDDLDTDLYIQCKLIKVDQKLYLIDSLGLLYFNNNHGEIVGRRVGDEIHWYQ